MSQTKALSRDEREAQELHREAMDLAEEAFLAEKRDGKYEAATQLTQAAFLKEKQAALRLADRADLRRTRAVLFRSAASLAERCNELDEARQLIERGLESDPPSDVAAEMQELLEQITTGSQERLGAEKTRPRKREQVEVRRYHTPVTDKDVQTLMDEVDEIRKLLGQLTRTLPKRSRKARELVSAISMKSDSLTADLEQIRLRSEELVKKAS